MCTSRLLYKWMCSSFKSNRVTRVGGVSSLTPVIRLCVRGEKSYTRNRVCYPLIKNIKFIESHLN